MATPKQRYVAKLNQIAARFGSMEDALARRQAALLRDLQRQLAAELATAKDFNEFRIRTLNRNIDRMLAEFESRLNAEVVAGMEQAIVAGQASAVEPINELGLQRVFLRPSQAQVNVALDFTADLVKDITADVRKSINTQIRLATLGGQSPTDAMRAITNEFFKKGVRQGKPVVTGISARSEAIVRTELQRSFNLANASQQQANAEIVPGLMKSWVATVDARTRNGHLKAHLDYKEPIPIDEPFIVYDIDDKGRVKGRAELRFPTDPQAPPQYTVNCRCRMVTIHPEVGRIGTPLDARLQRELDRRGV